ncbi:multidrug efflux SMR transporter [Undibacterium sp. Jales W-56]|uniref:DMT family transporter n=1 Tax=Undibacterium sp. Jales W-56 TaxID=2897325 RepID=UPI0021D19E0F|nr:multidrug efflux SMR transporter [Undibacterium sp. Jales W-56]MCU6433244.1 multidrug efflux SMR transporter [Undibacterium sp. Jales W-56]
MIDAQFLFKEGYPMHIGNNINPWILLMLTIVCEVIATVHLRLSNGFTKLLPSSIVVIGYGCAFWGLSIVMRRLEIGITYAVWSGVGTVFTTIAGIFLFEEGMSPPKIIGILLIVCGVMLLQLGNSSH